MRNLTMYSSEGLPNVWLIERFGVPHPFSYVDETEILPEKRRGVNAVARGHSAAPAAGAAPGVALAAASAAVQSTDPPSRQMIFGAARPPPREKGGFLCNLGGGPLHTRILSYLMCITVYYV
jgi:hypothetical protein